MREEILLLFDQKNKLHEKTDFAFEEFLKETQRVTTIFDNSERQKRNI